MTMMPTRLAALALALCSAALPASFSAFASSTAASSASEGMSASVGSVSDSFETSSEGSSKKEKKETAGDYKVIDMAEVAERPGTVRLTLQPVGAAQAQDRAETPAETQVPADNMRLYVPARVLAQQPIANGDVISAKPRPYGVEFARADTGRAFYLVLHDDWYRELQSNAVVL